MEFDIIEMLPQNENYEKTCLYLEEEIVKENLSINGGTLRYQGLIYDSHLLLIAIEDGKPIGFAALLESNDMLYVNQIAIKKEFQQKGVGSKLIKKAIDIAEGKNIDVTANVMDYNTNSQKMFTNLGFVKLGYTSEGDGFYRFYQKQNKNTITK